MLSKEFHTHINSALLHERHRGMYEELYHACPTVVSVPAILLWSPTYSVGPGGIGIVSKLPLRIHIGIEPLGNGHLEFGPTRYYIPERDEFIDWDPSRANQLFLPFLTHIAKKEGKNIGARIWCISEIPWYRGLNVDPTYAAPAAAAWLLHLGILTPPQIIESTRLPSEKLSGSATFEKIFRLAWKLESLIAHWLADGHMSFGALVDSQYPIVFFRERDPILFDRYRDFGLDHPSSYYNVPDNLFFRGMRMNELFQFDPNPGWPLDIALVFTGEEGDSRFVYQSRGAFKARLDEVASVNAHTFKNLVPETFRETPRFLELLSENAPQSMGMNLFRVYREGSVVHSMTVLKTLQELFQYGPSREVLMDFLHAQNICEDFLRIMGLSPLAISRPRSLFRMLGRRHTEAGVASRLIGPGVHGCLMVAGGPNTLENILNEALPLLHEETHKTIHCHYASWCDGNNTGEGIKVEQYVEAGIYADLTHSQSVTVTEWNGDGAHITLLCTSEKWSHEKNRYDLLLDAREGRVLVRGTPLTSDHIHSAKQTIELFRQFFKHGGELHADELPESCYRADRNQMESKIVRPLVNAIKTMTGRPLAFEVHGGLRSNYTLRFQPDRTMRIGFVEKV